MRLLLCRADRLGEADKSASKNTNKTHSRLGQRPDRFACWHKGPHHPVLQENLVGQDYMLGFFPK